MWKCSGHTFPLYVCVSNLHASNKASKHEVLTTFQGDFTIPVKFGLLKVFFLKYTIIYMHPTRKNRQQLFAGLVIWSLQQHTPDTVL